MSFFKNIFSKGIDTIGRCIEKVGEVTHIWAIESLGIDIQINNPVKERVDPENPDTSVKDTIDVHMACETARKEAMNKFRPAEDEYISKIEDEINQVIDKLKQTMPEEAFDALMFLDVEAFEKEIRNVVSDYVSDNISVNNPEYINILKMDDEERKKSSKEFVDKVICGAANELYEQCKLKRFAIYKELYKSLEDYFSTQRKIGEEYERNVKEIQKHQKDTEYKNNATVHKVVSLAYMECIRTLTYSNS